MERELHPSVKHLLQFFVYEQLAPHLQAVSKPFALLANRLVYGDPEDPEDFGLPQNPELAAALRKLLEAKDCAVRTLVAK